MRFAFNAVLVISLLYLPWWAGAIIVISACFLIDRFFEAVAYGIVADAVYGSRYGFYGYTHVAALYALVVLAVASYLRKRMAW